MGAPCAGGKVGSLAVKKISRLKLTHFHSPVLVEYVFFSWDNTCDHWVTRGSHVLFQEKFQKDQKDVGEFWKTLEQKALIFRARAL